MTTDLHPRDLYRLPWSLNDNILSWLEPTKRCNLYCEGCYSANLPNSDKTLAQVRADLDAFVSQRRVDSVSIAGGDPLVHPEIVDIVRMIRSDYGLKPVINTNGLALDRPMLEALAKAGLYGLTLHIDSSQTRPGWKGANELELNALRLELAQMVADVGGMSLAFNSTVFPDTLKYVPALTKWAEEHIELVHTMVFILFRTMRSAEYEYFAQGEKVTGDELVYHDQDKNPAPLKAHDVVAKIREVDPAFAPSAYLGGTKDPNSFKWLLSGRIGWPGETVGYVGPKYMEMVQSAHHMFAGRYLAYVQPEMLSKGRSMLLGFSPFDHGVRDTAKSWAKRTLRSPSKATKPLHFQSILIIQPIDVMADGELNMCDGCPDMTVHDGELVWSCRLDEHQKYGCFLTAAPPKGDVVPMPSCQPVA